MKGFISILDCQQEERKCGSSGSRQYCTQSALWNDMIVCQVVTNFSGPKKRQFKAYPQPTTITK